MERQLLPLGSVVMLKGGKKKLMIFGRMQISNDDQRLWDYVSCLYPEGNLGPEYCFLFNHADIDSVLHEGYSDEEDMQIMERLVRAAKVRDDDSDA